MIVKMKFLSISGPRTDIDRVCDVYLSKYEMQLENAIAELKTTDNLLPFVEVNPYKEPLAKAEEFMALLKDGAVQPDLSQDQDQMIGMIRDLNHEYLELIERKERLKKHEEMLKEKLNVLEPFRPLGVNLHDVMNYRYMRVRFGRIAVDYYRKLEKYLFEDLNAVFMEGTRNENYVYGCYFVANADASKADSIFNSLHFERITLSKDYIGTPVQACESLQLDAVKHMDCRKMKQAIIDQNYEQVIANMQNTLELPSTLMVPEIKTIKEEMMALGFDGALMSGSGSCVFGITRNQDVLEKGYEYFKGKYFFVRKTKILNKGDLS